MSLLTYWLEYDRYHTRHRRRRRRCAYSPTNNTANHDYYTLNLLFLIGRKRPVNFRNQRM